MILFGIADLHELQRELFIFLKTGTSGTSSRDGLFTFFLLPFSLSIEDHQNISA